jgi:hypothetical protein
MAGQCLRGQPEAAWGHLHQDAPARSRATQAPEGAQLAQERRLGEASNQRRLEAADPEG